jgi:hypothetical protein
MLLSYRPHFLLCWCFSRKGADANSIIGHQWNIAVGKYKWELYDIYLWEKYSLHRTGVCVCLFTICIIFWGLICERAWHILCSNWIILLKYRSLYLNKWTFQSFQVCKGLSLSTNSSFLVQIFFIILKITHVEFSLVLEILSKTSS